MKPILYIITFLLITSCANLNKEDLKDELNSNSFTWIIELKDSTIYQEIHFFQDSLYVLAFEDEDGTYAQFGYWKILDEYNQSSLYLNDIIKDFSPKIESWHNNTLKLSHSNISYRAEKIKNNHSNLSSYLIGSWFAPYDSIPNPLPEFDRTGKFLTNSTFIFEKDSFKIRTEGFIRKGKYQIVNNSKYVALDVNRNYWQNYVLIIESIDSTKLKLRLKEGYMSNWKSIDLEKNGIQNGL